MGCYKRETTTSFCFVCWLLCCLLEYSSIVRREEGTKTMEKKRQKNRGWILRMGSSSGRLSSWTCDAMRARQGRLDEAGRSRRVRVCFRVVYLFVWWCAKSAYVGCCVWFGWQVNERCITAQRGILAWNRSFFTLGEKGREANAEMKKNRNLVGFCVVINFESIILFFVCLFLAIIKEQKGSAAS